MINEIWSLSNLEYVCLSFILVFFYNILNTFGPLLIRSFILFNFCI